MANIMHGVANILRGVAVVSRSMASILRDVPGILHVQHQFFELFKGKYILFFTKVLKN